MAFILYAASCGVSRKLGEKLGLPIIISGAVLFRVLSAGPVICDDDIYRYHWDGKVLAHGINPYQHPPDAPDLQHLRDEHWDSISYRYIGTIYPPLTEALSAVSYLIWPEPGRIRVIAALFDLLTLVPIVLILRRLGQSANWAIAYAWNPLPIKEFANSGHLDSVAVCATMLALYLLMTARPVRSGVLWGASLLAKTYTLVLFPLYLRRHRWVGIIGLIVVGAAGIVPFLGAESAALDGTRAYAATWEFNSGLFALEQLAFGRDAAKVLNGLAWLAIAGLVMLRPERDESDITRRAGLLIGAVLILSPVCNPWYVCWLLPILCIHRSPAGLGFTALVMISYVYYLDAGLDPPGRVIEYTVLALLLVWEHVSANPHRLWRGLGAKARQLGASKS